MESDCRNECTEGSCARLIPTQIQESVAEGDESVSYASGSIKATIINHTKVITQYETFATFRVQTLVNRSEYPGRFFVVNRRYSAFEWLQNRLHQKYPMLFVPPLPAKIVITALNRFSDSFLSVRIAGLQAFLKRLTRHPLLSCDPDVVAFLTLPDLRFSEHRAKHAPTGFLAGLLSEVRFTMVPNDWQAATVAGSAAAVQEQDIALSQTTGPLVRSSSSAAGASGAGLHGQANCELSQTMLWLPEEHLARQRMEAEEFQGYLDETDHFVNTCDCLSHASDCIIGSLESLSSGFSEIGTCLKAYPPRLMTTNGDGSLAPFRSDCRSRREPEIVANAANSVALATDKLRSQLRVGQAANWKEMATYAQAIRSVLNTRGDIERRYSATLVSLKAEMDAKSRGNAYNNSLPKFAKIYLPWRPKSLPELVKKSHQLQNQLTVVNGHVRGDFSRWQSERSQETVENLLAMASAYAAYYSQLSEIWRMAIADLEAAKLEEGRHTSLPADSQWVSSPAREECTPGGRPDIESRPAASPCPCPDEQQAVELAAE